jgi:hypothetical protein
MAYVKKPLTAEDLDGMRIALSARTLKLSPEPVCDFCGSSEPRFVYAAVRLSTGEFVANWRWCACVDCSEAIDRDDWRVIENKVIAWLRPKFPQIPQKDLRLVAKRALLDFNLYAQRQD